jgi:hypothetical protein
VALFCARRDPVYEDYSQFLTRAFQGSHATRLQQRQKQSHLKNYGQHRLPTGWAQVVSPSPGPTMKKQQSHQQPRRSPMNNQQSRNETHTRFVAGHVAQAKDVMNR